MPNNQEVKRTERGWPGHFIGAKHCLFRRNTLLEYGEIRIVVSTVGAYRPNDSEDYEEIAPDTYYETAAFHTMRVGSYWDSETSRQISFRSMWHVKTFDRESDGRANIMHEIVVNEISSRMIAGEFTTT